MKDLTNKKLLKEWKKIETANIFSTLEEFADFYYANGEKSCYRKYTSYPWSTQNFFFGTYEEFSLFQKTTTEIPFYLDYKIGTKVFNLTILSFFRDENNKICAKCKCDCGNEVVKLYDSILKGNARTCGCHNGQGKKDKATYITDINNEFIKKYWDYDKNNVDPSTVEIGDSRNFWWKGIDGSYEMPASCLHAKKAGTSFPEQAILFFIKKKNIEVEHRRKFEVNGKKYEVDIFIPKYNIAIEYDGVLWHKEKGVREQEKNEALCSLGIFLIRVRETGLKSSQISKGCEIERDLEKSEDLSLSEVINTLYSILNEFDEKLNLLPIIASDLSVSKPLIHSQYYYFAVEDNINTSWLKRLWSKDNSVPPYMVSCKSNDEFIFNCHSGKIQASPSKIVSCFKNVPINERDSVSKKLLYNGRCPFTLGNGYLCPANCKYYLENYIESCEYSPYSYQPFDKFISNYKKKMETQISLEEYQKLIVNLLEYARIDFASIIMEGLDKASLSNKEKFNLLYNTICYPHMLYAQVNKMFSHKEVRSFYFDNYDYDKLNTEDVDLNFNHDENIYGVISCLIHEKNINILEEVLSAIRNKVKQEIYDNLIYNSFLQFYTKLSHEEDSFFDEKLSRDVLYNILKRDISIDAKEKIDKAICSEKHEFSEKIFIDYLLRLKNNNLVSIETIKTFSSRLGHSYKFLDFFTSTIDNVGIDINLLVGYKEENKINFGDLGLGRFVYDKRQKHIELYRYLLSNRLRVGTLRELHKHLIDNECRSLNITNIIYPKLHDYSIAVCETKKFNYFELFFNDKESVVHEKYGKYATDIKFTQKTAIINEKKPSKIEDENKIHDNFNDLKPQSYSVPLSVDIDIKINKEDKDCQNSIVSKLNTFNLSIEKTADKISAPTNDFADLCKPKKEKKKTDRKKSKDKTKKVFGIIWLILKWIFYIFWEVFNFLFLVLLFIIGFLDGLFFHKIRMQGVYKRAAQKAAATRKRNAPYKNSKRPRAYNLK